MTTLTRSTNERNPSDGSCRVPEHLAAELRAAASCIDAALAAVSSRAVSSSPDVQQAAATVQAHGADLAAALLTIAEAIRSAVDEAAEEPVGELGDTAGTMLAHLEDEPVGQLGDVGTIPTPDEAEDEVVDLAEVKALMRRARPC